ncbi:MAG: ATP synthase F1 subunit gamma [Flavobacteriaceae bacterium]|nr:ATP synthase F1 subunit gamma [Flavobacteriaceae bacterium]
MANLKEIRNRIASVSSTMQITSAMKMVSAAKLKKAQDAITAMRPYSRKLTELMQNLSASSQDSNLGVYADNRPVKRALVVAITSNRGLCGAFNSNVIKKAKNLQQDWQGVETDFYTIGKRGTDSLKKVQKPVGVQTTIFDSLTFDNTALIAEELMQLFSNGTYDKIVLIYNSFKNAANQEVLTEQFLPILPIATDAKTEVDYIFEPEKEEILASLIPKSLKTQLYKALRDSFASEHGARMTAMHKATDNASELRSQLKITYNKARQAAITNEILEIVSGAEALNG